LKNLKKEPNIGLANLGDTSYLNAVLRCLGHIEAFALFLLNNKVKEYIENNAKKCPLSFVTERLFYHFYPYPDKIEIYKPKCYFQILSNLNCIYKENKRGNPVDLLNFILSVLHDELNQAKKNENINNQCNNNINDYIKHYIDSNNSIISQTVSWFQKTHFTCSECNEQNSKFKAYNTFELDISNTYNNYRNQRNLITINDCLSIQLDQKKMNIYCQNCKQIKQILAQSKIHSTSDIFIFLLNRGINFDFANSLINIPFSIEEKLNIDGKYFSNNSSQRYELFGIVSIFLEAKKFVAFCKSFIDKKWYFYNDEKVNELNFDAIRMNTEVNKKLIPCILFYKKI
jgi:ubiquitin C-terminal hydrolase